MALAHHPIQNEFFELAPSGYYLGLRIRFAFAATEVNELPSAWVDLYSREKFFLTDPALRWSYDHVGAIRWRELAAADPQDIIPRAAAFGLEHGVVAAFNDGAGLRSLGLFFRADRDYTTQEVEALAKHVETLHRETAPPTTLTRAEIEVLKSIKDGVRIKQVAHDLGVSEGAIKQRLRNARAKLGATNATHATSLASEFGLI